MVGKPASRKDYNFFFFIQTDKLMVQHKRSEETTLGRILKLGKFTGKFTLQHETRQKQHQTEGKARVRSTSVSVHHACKQSGPEAGRNQASRAQDPSPGYSSLGVWWPTSHTVGGRTLYSGVPYRPSQRTLARGVKLPCSTCRIRCSYALVLTRSCCR